MKKTLALFLAAVMLCMAIPAFAAGKLSVVKENFHFIPSYFSYGYVYAKVENVGDRPIKVNAGVLELYDAEGEVLTSTDYMNAYATYLQPGEYTYVKMYEDVEDGQVAADYMLNLTGKSASDQIAVRLPVQTDMALSVVEGWWTYNYIYATVTNNTDETVYSIEVVLAVLDADGNILHIEEKELYSEIGLLPGSSVTIRKDISSTYMDYFAANGLVPASVDAIAYVLVDAE